MNSTLDELIENININLQDIYGSSVKSALEVCKRVREIIKENEFYKSLEKNGLEELLVFRDDIENMGFIFLRSSTSEENLKKIIKIVFKINYFDEVDYSKGGILDGVECQPIDIGLKIKKLPLTQVVMALQLKDISHKEKSLKEEIKELEDKLNNLKNKEAQYLETKTYLTDTLRKLTETDTN